MCSSDLATSRRPVTIWLRPSHTMPGPRSSVYPLADARSLTQGLSMSSAAAVPRSTPKQGQYLAFIYAYTRVLGRPPAEADLQRHFGLSPPYSTKWCSPLSETD